MDKIAANNLFVSLRKEIKKAKAMVAGNLIRKIAKLKKEKEKLEDEENKAKVDSKVDSTLNDIKLLKTIDSYSISKKAILNPNIEFWNKVVSDSKATAEEKLSARVILKNNIQKQTAKFRKECQDCDEWLNEYIEYREKKREIITKPRKTIKRKSNKDHTAKFDAKKENQRLKKTPSKRLPKDKLNRLPKGVDQSLKPQCGDIQDEHLHPSWEVKRKQKELLKSAFSGDLKQSKAIKFDS